MRRHRPTPAGIDRRHALGLIAAVGAFSPVGGAFARTPGRLDGRLLDQAATAAAALDQLHAFIVAHDGETVLAEAFRGRGLARPANVKSVSKTLVAILVGVAIDKGLLTGPAQTLGEAAPGLIPKHADRRVRDIRLGDLLSMQSGLERMSGPNYGRWVQSADWVAFALSRPFVDAPAGRMLYSTANYHVLGAVLAAVSGKSLLDLARAWIGAPLDIDIPPWTKDPQGRYLGGNNMRLSPMGMLRFGEMARRGGAFGRRRAVSRDWLAASWRPRARSPWSGHDYGYGWFLTEARGHPVVYARGYGGQLIYVAPTLGLTAAITSDPTRPARSGGYIDDLHRIFAAYLAPAAGAA